MTNEKLLERLYEIKRTLSGENLTECEFVKNCNTKDWKTLIVCAGTGGRLQCLINTIEEEIKENTFKKSKSDRKDALKYAKAWQKTNIKIYGEHNGKSFLCYPNYEDNYQVFADAFKAVFLTEEYSLPFDEKPESNKADYIIKSKTVCPNNVENLKEIELPDISALDTYIKTEYMRRKGTMSASDAKRILITFDIDLSFDIRADYLQTVMHIIPNCKAYANNQLLYLEDGKGNKAVIMGVFPKKGAERTKTVI